MMVRFIDRYRQAEIIVCTGLGAWEQDGLPSYYKLKEAFEQKNIPAWFSEWGHDVAHDWEWWRKQCLISLTYEPIISLSILSKYYKRGITNELSC